MRALLLYYTGTFNTRYITNIIEKRLVLAGFRVDKLEIDGFTKPISLANYDLIGLGYPIYAFNTPKIFIKYLKALKFNNSAKYFIYKNSGETYAANNSSSWQIKHILKKNKCILKNEHHFVMPYNIHFRFEDNCIKEMLHYDDKLADILVYEITHDIEKVIKSNWVYNFNSWLFLIQRFGAKINHSFYTVNYDRCIHCNLCVNTCPTKNIEVKPDGKLRFKNDCQMCMRCSLNCPKDAIKIGLLEMWHVNKPYNFKKILNDEKLDGHFIHDDQKGFFKCYVKTYHQIDETYDKYFKNEQQ